MSNFVRVQKENGDYITINTEQIKSVELNDFTFLQAVRGKYTSTVETTSGEKFTVSASPEDLGII